MSIGKVLYALQKADELSQLGVLVWSSSHSASHDHTTSSFLKLKDHRISAGGFSVVVVVATFAKPQQERSPNPQLEKSHAIMTQEPDNLINISVTDTEDH